MKILHCLHYPDNGIVTVAFDQIRHSTETGIDYHVALLQRSPKVDRLVAEYGIQVHYLERAPTAALADYRRLLKTLAPDIVHTHSYRPRLMTALAKRLGWWDGSSVTTIHADYPYLSQPNLHSRLKRAMDRAALRVLHCPIIVNSQRVYDRLVPAYDVSSLGIHKIHNGVAWTSAVEAGGRAGPVAISVARFTPEKNHDQLLDAWAEVVGQVPDAKLWLLGDGERLDAMQAKAKNLGIDGSVVFHGWVDRDEVPGYLARARVFVLSSFHEGLSTAAIEATLAGLPIVSTDVSGIDEIIEPGHTGLIVNGRREMADALVELLSDPRRCEAAGQRARGRAERLFGVERYLRQVEDIYRAVLPLPTAESHGTGAQELEVDERHEVRPSRLRP